MANKPAALVHRYRHEDKKRGFLCDIDSEFIEKLIKNGCSYCGETSLHIGLDRIDNDKGHLKDNVVACCTRCNYARKDMPYTAWLQVADGMRRARELGLFGSWTGGNNRRRKTSFRCKPGWRS